MTTFDDTITALKSAPRSWLVTGCAGFIGSNLIEALLNLDQRVVGLDNFATGHRRNLEDVKSTVGEKWANFEFREGDIADPEACKAACQGAELVLHQAALGSVPRSIDDPVQTNRSNIDGFLNMLVAARDSGVKRFVYAASSSTYGDHPGLPKVESEIGNPLSPYAVTKYVNELYAGVFASCYGFNSIGLRYFNIFGPRQDPDGAYAAVIPKWTGELLAGQTPTIFGDGTTSRDFCYVDNAVQANILSACTQNAEALNQVYNIAVGDQTTLTELYTLIGEGLKSCRKLSGVPEVNFKAARAGDVKHSKADISKANRLLGYEPPYSAKDGLKKTVEWFAARANG